MIIIRMVKTEDSIINSMRTLLESYTIENITVSSICKEAHINRAVFYVYFTDKYDLLSKSKYEQALLGVKCTPA